MVILKWDPKLELGIDLIDQQHKNILNEANAFFISYKAGNPKSRLAHCLTFLEQYVMYHFQAEEAFQVECGYPDYLRHQSQHTTLKMQFRFHATSLMDSSFTPERVDEFHVFVRDWIFNHMMVEDMKFITCYHAKCAEQAEKDTAQIAQTLETVSEDVLRGA